MNGGLVGPSRAALGIAFVYLVVAALWILLSDRALATLVRDPADLERFQTFKGVFFVVVTASLLLIMLRRSFSKLAEQEAARTEAERKARRSLEQLLVVEDNLPSSYVYRYVRDAAGPRFVHVSAGVERVHGVKAGAVLADAGVIYSLVAPEFRDSLLVLEQQSAERLTDFEIEVMMRRADGEMRWIQLRSRPRRTENGSIVWDGVATDVTDRKSAEAELRLSQAKFLHAFENNPSVIAITRLNDGMCLEVNDTWVELTGFLREEVIGRSIRHVWVSPESAARFVATLRQVGSVRGWEEEFRKKNGEVFTAELSARLLPMEGGDAVISTLVDVTGRDRQQRRLALLADISGRLVVGGNPRELVRRIFADLARELGCEVFANYRMAADGTRLELESCAGLDAEQERRFAQLAFGDSLCGIVAERRQSLVFADLPSVTLPQAAGIIALGVRAYSGHPMMVENQLFGTISFGSRSRNAFADEDIRLMRAVVDQVAVTLERLHLFEQLRESEELLRQMAENIDEVLWIINLPKNELLYVSPAYERIWGRSCASLTANPSQWIEAIVPEDRERVQKALETQAEGNYRESYRITRPDGATRWIADSAYPILDASGKAYRVVGVARDITETKQLEEQFLRAQRMEAVGTLASGVAHDLNNILAPIMMVGSLLRRKYSAEEDHKLLGLIEQSAHRGAGIVAQLLTFSRGLGGEKVEHHAEHLVKEIARLLEETFPRNIVISQNHERDLPTILANPTQIHQVLMNLCVNARDAMPDGGRLELAVRRAEVSAEEASRHEGVRPGAFVVLSVTDSGHGIPPEIRHRVFDPFFTTKEVGKGTGLGLATVAGIVRGHGGFITLDSECGRGTRFAAFLPASENAPPPAPPREGDLPRGQGECVLIVDDEKSMRFAMRELLQSHGYRVLDAAEGASGLELLRQHVGEVRLVITDYMMPGIDGLELASQVRACSPVPVLICSGVGPEIDRVRVEAAGVRRVLNKPLSARTLLEAVTQALL